MENKYLHISRHWILLFFIISRYILLLVTILGIYFSIYNYLPFTSHYFLTPVLIIVINYLFLQVILKGLSFFWKSIILLDSTIILISNSLFIRDDLEYIDVRSILKIDIERHWLSSNFLDYWHLVIEQRNDLRKIHYVPHPHKVYELIKQIREQKERQDKVLISSWQSFF